jgi:hypothetical protein
MLNLLLTVFVGCFVLSIGISVVVAMWQALTPLGGFAVLIGGAIAGKLAYSQSKGNK